MINPPSLSFVSFYFTALCIASGIIFSLIFLIYRTLINEFPVEWDLCSGRIDIASLKLWQNYPFYNYSKNWIRLVEETPIFTFNTSITYKYRCNFNSTNIFGNSDNHDMIITSSFGDSDGIEYFIRSLRTVNCQAVIILLIDDQSFSMLSPNLMNVINQSQLYLINIGALPLLNAEEMKIMHFIAAYDFLHSIRIQFNRVYLGYLNDTFFFNDPLTRMIQHEQLTFVRYTISLKDNNDQVQNFQKICTNNSADYLHRPLITSSMMIGPQDEILMFLDTLLAYFDSPKSIISTADAYVNALIHEKKLSNRGVMYQFMTEGYGYIETIYSNIRDIDLSRGKTVYWGFFIPSLVIHGYRKFPQLTNTIMSLCPKT